MTLKKPEQSAAGHDDPADSLLKAESQLRAGFAAALDRHLPVEPNPSLVIAYSGGLDSHVLLLVAAHWVKQHPSSSIRAVYIDHGLQAGSADWALHCESVCEATGIPFSSVRVHVAVGDGQSPEESARMARYAAFEKNLQAGEYLLTAHHADDQAETLMLQLMRGAGVRGLAAMPERRSIGTGFHLRPLLSVTRDMLQSIAQHWQLQWVEDPTNQHNRYNRNLLRNTVMPLLRERWPSAALNLSRAASHCAEAAELNRQLARIDLDQGADANVLPVERFSALGWARRKNALRYWIELHGFQSPSTAQLEQIDQNLLNASEESSGQVRFGSGQICRYRNQLYLASRECFAKTSAFSYVWNDRRHALHIEETGDTLTAEQLDLPWLQPDQPLKVCSRVGGERIRLIGHSQSHSVKSLLQQKGIPPWQRSRLPFLYLDERLVGVIGIGFSATPHNDI